MYLTRKKEDEEEEVYPDTRHLLVICRLCLAPKSTDQFLQRNKLFQSRCTINGNFCTFLIDFGSCGNVIFADAVRRLELKEEPHPSPYKLAWLHQDRDALSSLFLLAHPTKIKHIVT